MAFKTTKSDIVVAIDFGMTCSGVAYSYGPDWPEPKSIQHWPGKQGHEIRNKVDTSVSYDLRTNKLVSWGCLCNPENDNYEYNSLFKLYLDPEYRDSTPDPPGIAETQRWYLDYMTSLYRSLIKFFDNIFPRFASSSVDFVFSVPVTWKNNPALLADIERLISNAGYGTRAGDSASITLSEAEAAAVHASKGQLRTGDVFMVCDAGGGTTDITSLKVLSTKTGIRELYPLSWTEGASVGSTLIDYKVREIIRRHLLVVGSHLSEDVMSTILDRMIQDRFEAFKCSFGYSDVSIPKLVLPMPEGIEGPRLIITDSEIRDIFDDQIAKMCDLIEKQLATVRQRHPIDPVSYLVLSGGLGSSPYVQSCIRARFESRAGNDSAIRVLVSSEPQMAVAHGLALSRMQGYRYGEDVLTQRCLGVSYGILCKELYEPSKHFGEHTFEDPYDKRKWVDSQIHWILKQGQPIKGEYTFSEKYSLKIDIGREADPWRTTLVTSSLPVNQLPRSLQSQGASIVCSIEASLSAQDMKRKNRHWYDLAREYNRAEFLLRVIVGNGLRFEISSLDGTVRSRSHEISVQWSRPVDRAESMQLKSDTAARIELEGSPPGVRWGGGR